MSERTQKRVGSNASTIQKQHVVIITNDDDDDDNGRTSVYKQNVMRKIFTTRTPTPLIYLFLRDKKCVVCIWRIDWVVVGWKRKNLYVSPRGIVI